MFKKRPCHTFQNTGHCSFGNSCKYAHVDSPESKDNWALQSTAHGRRPAVNARQNSGNSDAFGGARGEAFGWFDETPSAPPGRQHARQQPRQQNRQPSQQQPPHHYPQQRVPGGQNLKRGSVRQTQQKGQNKLDNRQIPPPDKDPYAGVKKPRPLLDDSWKYNLASDNFRFVSVFPTDEDINDEEYPDPPENIVHKAYDSTEAYIETHFRLLRADCTLPVRYAIRSYRTGTVDDNDMMIYTHVRPMALLFASVGLVHRMTFIVDGRRVNWKQSKRLIPGTIVCLSTDHFEHFRFATVIERDIEYLQNPRDLRVGIMFLTPDSRLDFDPDISYTMIEAMQGYFEAYRHILKCLQDIDPANMPFQPQLVGLEAELEQPAYSRNISNLWDRDFVEKSVLEFPSILKGDEQGSRGKRVREDPLASSSKSKKVQPNVLDAMQRMLTSEFAIVQGPPGTGKTFLGLLTTRILLEQCRTAAMGPIIVICQTNHALDQFLEGIMRFEDRVIRLGSRSKSEKVGTKTLYNVRKNYKENPQEARNDGVTSSSPVRLYKLKTKLESEMLSLLEEMAVEYVPLTQLLNLGVISQEQFDSFACDGWVTRFDQEENPTAEPWLRAAPPVQNPNAISVFDDASLQDDIVPEIDEEELQERVEEFMVGNIDEYKVLGHAIDVKQSIVCHVDDGLMGDVGPFMKIPNVHDIPEQKRMGVYKQWLHLYQATVTSRLGELNKVYNLVCENIRAELRKNDTAILRTARIIGMTTTAASKYHDLLCLLKPKVMMCEEASETMEAHLLCALTPSIEHFLLIGDHEQLRPSMSVDDLKTRNIDVSMFERLVKNNFPFSVLDVQRRMRPEIRSLIRPIYPKLKDHESVCNYGDVRGMVDNLWFLTHDEEDQIGSNNSHFNPHEAGVAYRLAIYLLQQGYAPSEVTILAMYSGQRNKILEKLRQSPVKGSEKIRVSTVDGFQGEENEVIILSLVRSNSNNSIGFLKTSNRVCVSLSRAKKGLYILGNGKLLMEQSELWSKIIHSLIRGDPSQYKMGNRIRLQCIRHPEMITEVALESEFNTVEHGGCSKPCSERFPGCGHPCPFKCHAGDHEEVDCNYPCERMLSCGNHPCGRNCGDACRPCAVCPR